MLTEHTVEKFEIFNFIFSNTLAILIFFASIKLLFPHVWGTQLDTSFPVFFTTFFLVHLAMAFVEFFFHRYVLHMNAVPFLSHFYVQHNLHHGLTAVTQESLYVSNEYPIEEEHQHEASFFPWYTFPLFSLLFTPFFIIVYLLSPVTPIFIAGYSALLLSIVLYEFIHNTWHMELATWKKLMQRKRTGALWHRIYTFHLRHHADVRCNESVSGFLGIPVPDLLFGTYIKANTLYPHKQIVDPSEFVTPKPIFFIHWLDILCLYFTKKSKM